mmetsp:Transcript_47582/g.115919  ORF Transcript_47582/g.115919 Transcript_47582/m.115919 type:complete len:291 (+) Transcript_47582:219-1091(+)
MLVSKLDHRASAPSTSMEASTATTVSTSTAAATMSSSLASVLSKSTISKTKMHCCSRTKLLNRLGYFQPPGINNKGMDSKALSSSSASSSSSSSSSSLSSVAPSSASSSFASILGSAQPLQTPLNDCFSCRRKNQHRNNKNSIRTNHDRRTKSQGQHQQHQQQSRRIRFHDTVMVMSIPSRHQYSNRIKCVLWSGRDELNEMSRRNVVEFQAEGWNWRTVVEDEDMYIDVQTGQKLHPCHIQQYHCDQQQHHQNYNEEEEEGDDDYSSDEDGDDRYFQPLKRQESSAFAA